MPWKVPFTTLRACCPTSSTDSIDNTLPLSNVSSPKKQKQRPPWIFQWNCRGFRTKAAELKLRIERMKDDAPVVILLQETVGTTPTIPGYFTLTAPSIPQSSNERGGSLDTPGMVLTLVRKHIPQSQIDTSSLNNEEREIVGVRIRLGNKTFRIYNVYLRPNQSDSGGCAWINEIMNNAKESVILAGDFNAPHNQWGYKKTLRRGRLIASLCKKHNLELLNDANTPTRFGASPQQDDTSPDLTWASPGLRTRWSVYTDTIGSDHVPLCTTLYIGCSPRKEIRFIKWDTFREALSTLNNTDLTLRIQEAMPQGSIYISGQGRLPISGPSSPKPVGEPTPGTPTIP